MASSIASVETLQTRGFDYEANAEIGERATQPFEDIDTEAGLKFYEEAFIKNERVADILISSFRRCNLIAYRKFSPDPKRLFQFRSGGEEAGCMLVVCLWPPGSEVIFYSDSRQHNLPVVGSDNGLWRVPQAAANEAGYGKGFPVMLEKGGWTIHDGRILVKFACCKPIAASFASDEFIQKWKTNRKPVSATTEMQEKLKASETDEFKLHIKLMKTAAVDLTTPNT